MTDLYIYPKAKKRLKKLKPVIVASPILNPFQWVGADDGEQAFVARLSQGKLRQQEGVTRAQGFG